MIQPQQFKAFLGLKWNPFLPDAPLLSLSSDTHMQQFLWRAEQLVLDGGYALITGEPGSGKSVALRLLHGHLSCIPELCVRILTRPQSHLRDFYRELAGLFGLEIKASNRYAGFQKLREQWLHQIQGCLFRPVLLIDEAQEVPEEVLSEIRILASSELDARCILAVVFAGDKRFLSKLQSPALLPLESRIRVRMHMDGRNPEQLSQMLTKALTEAGNPELMTAGVAKALVDQSLGNPRAMMIAANELMSQAIYREKQIIDENLYFEVFRGAQKRKKIS
jgi:type II secretory pathway predicted ATPase ExeA